ncbi:MAG: 3-dehydroquinate synthase [Elusimicrobia bacterium]|nr:3-dehydroquinate synthase [Elusimicrobiota bacterium]
MSSRMLDFKIDGRRLHAELPRAGRPLRVPSALGPDYEASFARGRGIFDELNALAAANDVFVLIDSRILGLYGKYLRVPQNRIFAALAEERFKTVGGVLRLLDFLDKGGANKASLLLVIGGGIMEDAGGFAATMFKRGIRWVFAPTTLLSMCDSCIGAKTGINFGRAKNQLGLFAKPEAVLLDPRLLRTLEHRHIRSGMGEILKMCVIGGDRALALYRKDAPSALACDAAALERLIALSLSIKKAVVEKDELERDIRKALNYGHTVGHALEALSGFRISHGEAVAMGMMAANEIAAWSGNLPKPLLRELENDCLELCAGVKLPRLQADSLGRVLVKDKKSVGGKVLIVAPRAVGDTVFLAFPPGARLWQALIQALTERFKTA